jgi:hypothetical protein
VRVSEVGRKNRVSKIGVHPRSESELDFNASYEVGTVPCEQDKEMKQARCLAASGTGATSRALPLRQAMGHRVWAAAPRIRACAWAWDRSTSACPSGATACGCLNAFAIALLTLLGAVGEALGYDRYLKSNTTKRRTHSLIRQGCMLDELIPTLPKWRLLPLIERFATMLAELSVFADTYGPI